ncbi:MAG: hypothetical protein M3345_07075 [Actinomycetota bacterium]|nr:hypothetical protein [Actinomycetota bacterium]
MRDELRRVALFGSGVAELTRHRAEQIVKDLVKGGEVRRDQTGSVVRDLLERNRQNRTELMRFLRSEVRNQVESLGVASKRDFERLERRIARLEDRQGERSLARAGGGSTSTASPTTATRKKTTATRKKTSAKKTSAKSTGAKKSTKKTGATSTTSSTKRPRTSSSGASSGNGSGADPSSS